MTWLNRRDLRVRGSHVYHVHDPGGSPPLPIEAPVRLREVALEEFSQVPSGEPIRLRVAACDACGAILAVLAVRLR